MKNFYLKAIRTFCCLIFIAVNIYGCSYFDVYYKTNYVSQITGIIKKNQDEMNNYVEITINKEGLSEKDLKEKYVQTKDIFTQNKKELEAIIPPEDYKDEHQNFVTGFQNCIDAVDASIAVIDTKDSKIKKARMDEAKTKIEESKTLIQKSISKISIDLR